MTTDSASLQTLFSPASIAVVGASNTLGKVGATPIQLLKQYGYPGRILPVNPKEHEVQGLACHATLGHIEQDIDLAILALPARHVCEALEQARPGQIRSAVLLSSGFAETGPEGRAAQARLERLAGERGIRLLGPNCLGFMNMRERVYATFSPAPLKGAAPLGHVGMVSQSGAFGAYAYTMAKQRGLGLSFWASTGNESDVTVADCIEWLVADPATRIIMAYMEGCKNGEKLKRALDAAARAGKPVVVTKIGRTASGARAAASHTAALAGDDAIYDALFRQYGAIRARSIEDFFNIGHALSVWGRRPPQASVGIVSISGGVGALMADEADDGKLALPALPPEARRKLLDRTAFASADNPVDVTGQAVADPAVLQETIVGMLDTGRYGALAVFLAAAGSTDALWPHICELADAARRHPDARPLALCALLPDEKRAELERRGAMVFSDPSAAIRTIAAARPRIQASPQAPQAAAVELPAGAGALDEAQSMQVLARAGVPVVNSKVAHSSAEAAKLAEQAGCALAMKILSADIPHKSDAGGVRLDVSGAGDAAQAYDAILESVGRHAPGARIDGVLLAPMIKDGTECIMGVHVDSVFGPVVMFGLGGIFVEVLKDVSFRLAPFDVAQARSMIEETRALALLEGARGQPRADIDAIAQALCALSQFAHAARDRLASVDVNPFVALPAGRGAMALDALVVLKA
ncbi:acetate--CoA ligase family protein [Candidimonas nitroreducens]|uniref:6-carboxyhexanoate--CoA ligase n=1 Tax=Candidimonas nitroreducens TaxID=683354 RepID=A0A225M4N3_9BURK|nr:acetate--CoA ligase family protein [Candidimonas nitroreducens]OWT55203.1 6-carboxyhexanoate--CoA ligase [Candidimonas nitroreducens]